MPPSFVFKRFEHLDFDELQKVAKDVNDYIREKDKYIRVLEQQIIDLQKEVDAYKYEPIRKFC